MSETVRPNEGQIAYWNEISGPKWVSLADRIHDQIEPLGRIAIERAAVAADEQVIDVGCGCGQTTLALAERVGEGGRVVGIDISGPMLDDARARAQRAARPGVEFLQADAQVHRFEPDRYDLVFSRFGVMFFDDPPAAFANLRGALRPGGRVCFVCWQAITKNPWMLVPAQAAASHVELPAPPEPGAPGPFAFADPDRVLGILERSGLEDPRCEALEGQLAVGQGLDLEAIVDFLQQMGPAGAALREAPSELLEKVSRSMREVLEPYYRDGALQMDYAAWIVTARR